LTDNGGDSDTAQAPFPLITTVIPHRFCAQCVVFSSNWPSTEALTSRGARSPAPTWVLS
jgi:hypothetical protein